MISVIVPIYNAEKYITTCLDSIIGQTYADLEIVLVDDGSTDNSAEICRKYVESDSRIKLICQENQGSTAARKNGILASKGDYISFIDSDDWLDLNYYEKLYNLMSINDADIIVSGCVCEEKDGPKFFENKFSEGFYDKEKLRSIIYPQMMYDQERRVFRFGILQYLCNKIYKREVILPCITHMEQAIFDGEDVACICDVCLRAKSIFIDNHKYYHYRIHDESICFRKRDEKYFINAIQLCQYMKTMFLEHEDGKILLTQLPYFMNIFINNGTGSMFGYQYRPKYSEDYLLPENSFVERTKVCIYGAGKVGRSFYRQLLNRDEVEIVSWADSNQYGKKIGAGYIDKPEEAIKKEWDYVLLAVAKEEQANQMREWLIENGIDPDVIIWELPKRVCEGYELEILSDF